MIHVTRLNGEGLTLNADLIEFIEATPDTMISLTTGRKVMVRESVEDVVQRTVDYAYAVRTGAILRQCRDASAERVSAPAEAE